MVEMHAYKEIEVNSVADAYCTERPVTLERKTVPMLEFYEKVSDTFTAACPMSNLFRIFSFQRGETTVERESAAVIYFASKDESVWDIARHYNTTVSLVMEENELSEEILSADKMLLIPG